ncbi:uncharacterized protein LOC132203702 [Neocloeon triangulifer]|uniref:uncharacterized protein LOC132203702 n=1 Tax=Neocloeon triangulifer TaxID=2078957 RepID=UPI00286ECFAD|nr:uncharacterized protein LOC132203702 [Neocloeon triangulifer]
MAVRRAFYIFVVLIFCDRAHSDCTNRSVPSGPLYFGTTENTSTENCGVVENKLQFVSSFPWDVVVFFKEDLCIAPGVVVSQRAVLHGTTSCKYSSGVTVYLAGIKTDYRNAPSVYVNVSHIFAQDNYSVITFPADLNSFEDKIKPVCLYNFEEEPREAFYVSYLNSDTEDDEVVAAKFYPQNISHCNALIKTKEHRDTFNSTNIICVTPADRMPLFSTDELLYMKVNSRFYLRGQFLDVFNSHHHSPVAINLADETAYIVSVVSDLYSLDPEPEPLPPPKFHGDENLSFPHCGRKPVITTQLIVSGDPVYRISSHPWHAFVGTNYYDHQNFQQQDLCGGTLISDRAIVTAAHCLVAKGITVTTLDKFEVEVAMGVFNRSLPTSNESSRQIRKVKQIFIHEKYNAEQKELNDIALIVVESPFDTSTEHVKPACLWNRNSSISTVAGSLGTVVGWGYTESFETSAALIMAEIPIIHHKECFKANRMFYQDKLSYCSNFCAGIINGTSVCNGDSGGGLITFNQNLRRFFLRGIVSSAKSKRLNNGSKDVCDHSAYALFTDVAQYVNWILEKLPELRANATQTG